jgi:hypothetical protein
MSGLNFPLQEFLEKTHLVCTGRGQSLLTGFWLGKVSEGRC